MRRITEEEIIQSNVRVYIHIAHALARGYTDLFYVNMDTDEFIEFHTEDERGVLNEARRGSDFGYVNNPVVDPITKLWSGL